VMLPELKANEIVHNEYYAGDNERADQLRARLEEVKKAVKKDGKGPAPPPMLLPGWSESRTPQGEVYYVNKNTGETSWMAPRGEAATSENAETEMLRLQAALKEVAANQRKLECTLYLTGAKPDQLKYQENAKPDSQAALVNSLLSATSSVTGEPYIKLKAGRPDWPGEFTSIAQTHGREDVGVVFCGAPMIAAALKENCEKLSRKDGTIFRLHKENF